MVTLFNDWYFIYMGCCILIIMFLYSLFQDKSKKAQYNLIFGIAAVNFILHFVKQFVYFNINDIYKSTAENICAISTLLLPFLLCTKKQTFFHDFAYFISIFGGFIALLYPTGAISIAKSNSVSVAVQWFETIRFYFCHVSLLVVPLFLMLFGFHKPKLSSAMYVPLCFLIYQAILCANTALVCFTKLVKRDGFTPLQLFLDNRLLNNSFTFGPTEDMGWFGDFVDFLIPNFMKYSYNGELYYWPVACLIIPSLFIIPVYLLTMLPFWLKRRENEKLILNCRSFRIWKNNSF